MSHSERLENLLKQEKLKLTQFSTSIEFELQNLRNYLKGKTNSPNIDLTIGVLRKYPHWNIRYWLLGEGSPTGESQYLKKIDEILLSQNINHPVISELIGLIAYLRDENIRKDGEIRQLKKHRYPQLTTMED